MRKIAADIVFPVEGEPIKNGVVVFDSKGTILDIYQESKNLRSPDIEYYDGVLIPGFVNAHSHLEYSYVKDLIEPKQGLIGFIKNIITIKQNIPVDYDMLVQADKEMFDNGINLVGDHTNTLITKDIKQNSKIYYHSFIELYAAISEINSPKADFYHGLAYLNALGGQGSITPHAPYSVSPELMKIVAEYAFLKNHVISVHNQETEGEREMFMYGTGEFAEFLDSGNEKYIWYPTGTSSIQWYLPFFRDNHNMLLIHNTYTTIEDLEFACNSHKNLYWVFCPGSNLYIEDKLPDVHMFMKNNCNIALGTDSYASNTKLSILYEMQLLQQAFEIDFETLLKWATLGGAQALALDHIFGSITKGKRPGLVLLQNIDLDKLEITEKVKIKRIF